MADGEPRYLLKMLSGPHLGAEVRLAPGSYRLGRHDDADIVLEDKALADEHALVTIEANGVRVEPLLGEVILDGAPHKDPEKRLPFFTVLGFGTTHLAIGPEDAAWPALVLPAGPPAVASAGAAAARAEILPPPAAVPAPARASGGRSLSWLAVPLALLALALVARPLEQTEAPAAVPAAEPDPEAELIAAEGEVRSVVAGADVAGLRLERDPRRGRILIEGWTSTEAQRKELVEQLQKVAAPLQLRLWSREQVMASVATTLQALGRPLEASWAGPGAVRLSGYIPEASDLQRAVDLLIRDVTGLKTVDNQVMTDEAVEAWMTRRLTDAGLSEVVRIKRGERALQVRGLLTPEQQAAFRRIAQEYADGPGRYLGLEAQLGEAKGPIAAPAPAAETARFAVRAASPGPPAYIVLDDGQKYLEGSRLPGGWTLERIDGSEMVVGRDGRREAVGF